MNQSDYMKIGAVFIAFILLLTTAPAMSYLTTRTTDEVPPIYAQPGTIEELTHWIYIDSMDGQSHYYELWEYEDYYYLKGSDVKREDTYFGANSRTIHNSYHDSDQWYHVQNNYDVPDKEGTYYLAYYLVVDGEHYDGYDTIKLIVDENPPTQDQINSLKYRIYNLQDQLEDAPDQEYVTQLENEIDDLEQEIEDLGGDPEQPPDVPIEDMSFIQRVQLLYVTLINYLTGGTV